jgi:hypothetical protein
MTAPNPDVRPMQDPEGQMEQVLIDGFLLARGLDSQLLQALPEADRRHLLQEASIYAAGKLAEIEARARFVHDLHGDRQRG